MPQELPVAKARWPVRRTPIHKAIDYIAENLDGPITIEMVAQACNLSPSHTRRLFRQRTGISAVTYINAQKVERACRLMQQEGRNVTQAAIECGFSSVSYFIDLFTRARGKTPKQWMKDRENEGKVLEQFV